ncbi:MAG TPA: CaiB/BaiF CoA-transferase family protein [Ensifer sp.]|nr:CaiB/BaiF CoA-transferase family protein [Ensifer sp.]
MANTPLSNIRVLDLSRILAGPWAAQYLADLGAEVIKVERPVVGDDARHYGPPYVKDADGHPTSENFFHLSCNRGKMSITVDMAKAEGQEIIRKIASESDVLVENFKVGDLARYGLDYESLRKLNPRLIYCSITGFGQTGPYRKRPGYDAVFQGMSGLMSVTGYPDDVPGGGPMKVGPSIVDIVTGLNAVVGIVSALYNRDQNGGQGQHVDLALFDSAVAALSHYVQIYLSSGTPPGRRGTQGNGGVPSQMFLCREGGLMLTAGNDKQYRALCDAIGHPEMITDPRFVDGATRIRNRDALSAELQEIFLQKMPEDWLPALEAAGVPSGPIYNFEQVFNDPQIKERGMKVTVKHPHNEAVDLVGNPLKFSETPITDYRAPPLLGEHTADILSRFGFDADMQADLKSRGVI